MSDNSKKPELAGQTRSERKRARVRADLLASARQVFAERGYHEASIAEITARADVGVGTFYLHFRDKDEAFTTLLDEGFRAMREEVQITLAGVSRLTLTVLVETIFSHAYTRRDLFQVALTARGQFARTRTFHAQDQIAEYLALTLEAARVDGLLAEYDLAVTARLITGMITQGIFWWFENSEPGPEIMARQVLLLLRRGLPEQCFSDEKTQTKGV